MSRRYTSRFRLPAIVAVALLAAAGCASGAGTPAAPTDSGAPTGGPASGSAAPPSSSDRFTAPASPSGSPDPSGSPSAGPTRSFDPARVSVTLEPYLEIPGAPLAVTAPADGSGRMFVTERGGRVWVVRDRQLADQPFLDVASRVTAGGEQGLLGFALHPRFPDDPRFFIYYTDTERDQVVAERRLDPSDPERADPDYERELLRMDDFAGNHNGGGLAFDRDGLLYIATGDGGGAGDPQATGQRLDTHLGKLLRIGVDGQSDGRPYTIPESNPFIGRDDARPEILHLGLRNPWRFSFDRETGDLWIGDVGQGQWEEIDVARDGEVGLNYGWSVVEGNHCFRDDGCSTEGLMPPVTEYSHDFGCSVTGGVVYRGSEWPGLRGAYLFADYCSGTLWAIDARSDVVEAPVVVAETGRSISSFGEDEAGELYVTDLDGALLRVVAPER